MSNLPNEVLHNIFILVPFRQRLECSTVCHRWSNILQDRSLLYEVEIQDDEILIKFIKMIQRLPHLGSQVEIFSIKTHNVPTFDKRHFCNMFPNLRIFLSENTAFYHEMQDILVNPFTLEYSHSKLKEIKDSNECELTRQLLMSNSCSRLTHLDLALDQIKNPREKLFVHLDNAPALEVLKLNDCVIGIKDCEIIHKNTPNLASFYLGSIALDAGELPHDIIPATSITSFGMEITEAEDHDTYPNWYAYLVKKYSGASFFEFKDSDLSIAEPTEALKIYRDGILPLYEKQCFDSERFYAINVPTQINVFDALYGFNYSIPHFILSHNEYRPIFAQLAESQQSGIVTHIELENTAILSPLKLKNFISLKVLEIDMGDYSAYWDADLNDFIDAVPATLTSFSAKFKRAKLYHLPKPSNNIEKFSLSCRELLPNLCEALSKSFPKLNDLYLEGIVDRDLDINLPNNHFKGIVIKTYYYDEDCLGFTVVCEEHPQKRYYVEGPDTFDSVVPATSRQFRYLNRVNLKYATSEDCSLDIAPVNSFDYDFSY